MFLGIDAGGTHTDAALISQGRVLAGAKARTDHDDLPSSVREVLEPLARTLDLHNVRRVALGTTLAINAIVQGRTDPVGLALSAGPGMDPTRHALGEHVVVVPGGLDHRGVEVTPLREKDLLPVARRWREQGVEHFAVVGKFSPRNPAHEQRMEAVLKSFGQVTQGHLLSGQLNFPRRVAGAWYNSAVWRIHNAFLDAVEQVLREFGVQAPVYLLKADGGAVPVELSRRHPVNSILSGPAASIMGVMALAAATPRADALAGDALLLDMGGTTTDIGLYAQGSPVLDRLGMRLVGAAGARCTPVRALASRSLGVGGDSRLCLAADLLQVGPHRDGPAMAFGGAAPTLLDAMNVAGLGAAGDVAASRRGLEALAGQHGREAGALAHEAVAQATGKIAAAVRELVDTVNAHPVYTLAALLEGRRITPLSAWLVGGPAGMMAQALHDALAMPVHIPPHADVANAVGAALTLPTAELELFADTTQGCARIPALDWRRDIPRNYTLEQAREDALKALRELAASLPGAQAVQAVEVLEEDLFATLDDQGYGGRDIRVRCQLVPGIACPVTAPA